MLKKSKKLLFSALGVSLAALAIASIAASCKKTKGNEPGKKSDSPKGSTNSNINNQETNKDNNQQTDQSKNNTNNDQKNDSNNATEKEESSKHDNNHSNDENKGHTHTHKEVAEEKETWPAEKFVTFVDTTPTIYVDSLGSMIYGVFVADDSWVRNYLSVSGYYLITDMMNSNNEPVLSKYVSGNAELDAKYTDGKTLVDIGFENADLANKTSFKVTGIKYIHNHGFDHKVEVADGYVVKFAQPITVSVVSDATSEQTSANRTNSYTILQNKYLELASNALSDHIKQVDKLEMITEAETKNKLSDQLRAEYVNLQNAVNDLKNTTAYDSFKFKALYNAYVDYMTFIYQLTQVYEESMLNNLLLKAIKNQRLDQRYIAAKELVETAYEEVQPILKRKFLLWTDYKKLIDVYQSYYEQANQKVEEVEYTNKYNTLKHDIEHQIQSWGTELDAEKTNFKTRMESAFASADAMLATKPTESFKIIYDAWKTINETIKIKEAVPILERKANAFIRNLEFQIPRYKANPQYAEQGAKMETIKDQLKTHQESFNANRDNDLLTAYKTFHEAYIQAYIANQEITFAAYGYKELRLESTELLEQLRADKAKYNQLLSEYEPAYNKFHAATRNDDQDGVFGPNEDGAPLTTFKAVFEKIKQAKASLDEN
ncbi:hypothetical protein OF377_00085 [Ureaplasma sp. ES3154-GEN]|uniref:Vmc-like lipoprotein signal peptide domain-containing protein n=1 Tax=Ureaplasma sp. ES3154-GEN TaxID=2984844 RepID=UPI0021E99CB9|nr:hypothetical protein [Ureaplasma sp. ES3154-GEN]MCV3743286.1 hypothetical protein [Ureaplasma sp. ES3154-GEN]